MKPPINFLKIINGAAMLCTRNINIGDYVYADYKITPDKWNHIQKEGQYLSDEFGDHIELKCKEESGHFIGNYNTQYAWKQGCYKIVSQLNKITKCTEY